MDVYAKLKELGIELAPVAPAAGAYVSAVPFGCVADAVGCSDENCPVFQVNARSVELELFNFSISPIHAIHVLSKTGSTCTPAFVYFIWIRCVGMNLPTFASNVTPAICGRVKNSSTQ